MIFTNLEWVTRSENLKHAWDNELFDREKRRNIAKRIALNNRNIYKVYRYDVKTKEIKEYEKIHNHMKACFLGDTHT